MRRRVDAEGPAGHDGEPVQGQPVGQGLGDVFAVRCRRAGTDDPHRPHAHARQVPGATHPQGERGNRFARLQSLGPACGVLGRPSRAGVLETGQREVRPLRRLGHDESDVAALGRGEVGLGVGHGPPGLGGRRDVVGYGAAADPGRDLDRTVLPDQIPQRNRARLGHPVQIRPGQQHLLAHAAHAPTCPVRKYRASATSAASGAARSARSARVQASRRTRSYPRALSRPCCR